MQRYPSRSAQPESLVYNLTIGDTDTLQRSALAHLFQCIQSQTVDISQVTDAIMQRLDIKQHNVRIQCIKLLTVLIERYASKTYLLRYIGTTRYMNQIVNTIPKRIREPLGTHILSKPIDTFKLARADSVLTLLQLLAQSYSARYPIFVEYYRDLQRKGVRFPDHTAADQAKSFNDSGTGELHDKQCTLTWDDVCVLYDTLIDIIDINTDVNMTSEEINENIIDEVNNNATVQGCLRSLRNAAVSYNKRLKQGVDELLSIEIQTVNKYIVDIMTLYQAIIDEKYNTKLIDRTGRLINISQYRRTHKRNKSAVSSVRSSRTSTAVVSTNNNNTDVTISIHNPKSKRGSVSRPASGQTTPTRNVLDLELFNFDNKSTAVVPSSAPTSTTNRHSNGHQRHSSTALVTTQQNNNTFDDDDDDDPFTQSLHTQNNNQRTTQHNAAKQSNSNDIFNTFSTYEPAQAQLAATPFDDFDDTPKQTAHHTPRIQLTPFDDDTDTTVQPAPFTTNKPKKKKKKKKVIEQQQDTFDDDVDPFEQQINSMSIR